MRVVVTGASGLVAGRLIPTLLKAGHTVVAVSRNPGQLAKRSGVLPVAWDGQEPFQVPGKVDAIVHLAGEPIIGRRWTARQRERLRTSRIQSTRRLVEFIARRPAGQQPVLVCANAVGYYGIRPTGPLTEEAPAGDDFLARLCQDWQDAAEQAPTRVVVLRFGHVMAKQGGYLGALLPLARLGLAGPLGRGKQPLPWIHIDDLCAILLWAVSNPRARGVYNATAPQSSQQKDLARAMNRVHTIPSLIPVPGCALRLRFGAAADPMLGGQDAIPQRLLDEGYAFGFTDLDDAIRDLLQPPKPKPSGSKAERLAAAARETETDED